MAKSGERWRLLLAMFDSGSELTLQEIMAKLGLRSDRHARRLLEELRREGKTINERRDGRHKRFSLAPEHRSAGLAGLDLTIEESLSLAVAAEASRAALRPSPLGASLESAFAKLLQQFGDVHAFDIVEEMEHWHFGTGGASAFDPAIFRTLEEAVRNQYCVLIDYTTASTGEQHVKRPIDPHVLAVRNGSWLVVAYCRRRKAMRDFSVAGITRAELCDPLTDHTAIFTPQTGFNLDSYFRKRFSALDSGELCTARLLVEPDRAVYFRRKKYHPSQVIEGEGEDGRIVVSFTVSGLEEIRSFAQGWGTGVTVVEPEELIERMGEEARELAERYGARHGNDINS